MEYNKFGEVVQTEEEKINGISTYEISLFIEKNEERYIRIFKKYENRKFFLHINWAALFLSVYWLFYRKMYKQGVAFLLCLGMFSTLMFSTTLVVLKDDILAIREQQNKVTFYGTEYTMDQHTDLSGYYTDDQNQYRQMEADFNKKLFCFAMLPFLVFGLFFGLIADCLYRNHVLRKIGFADGGVSKMAILGALGSMVIYNFIMDIIQKLVINIVLK